MMFIKQNRAIKIYAPADGSILDLSAISNSSIKEIIAKEGFVLQTLKHSFVSPISGKIVMILKTKRAYKIKTKAGIQMLLFLVLEDNHWKIDKFVSNTENGKKVKALRTLCDISLKKNKTDLKEEIDQIINVPILLTNVNEKTLKILKFGEVKKGDLVAILK
ncbi:hypothetical protein CXP39_02800 [Mesoplasma syrphidae]|uniref:PTS EIIA type-1 domain-containing protein n=1 Tax=Mesoplasma syrphidae TaxID=225999 RepID=A0A2K9BNU9_9MOLU|nr:PTS glucose transporter subunit IIA [Mesoplasma syrphidae]AUF83713.1 hypothetical protein CXP39_02800 [Mesoplasma syrphidae]